jgi:hypothetical protein
MNRFDLLEKLELRDPQLFKDEFMLIDPTKLGTQNLDNLYSNPLF